MAAEAHRTQLRSSGESYINHPLAVARIVADIGLDEISRRRRPAPRRGRGHRDHPGRRRARLRRRGRRHRRRRHQAGADPVRLARGPAGRHHAQDAGGDGPRPARAGHQARRPAAQHAHDRRDAGREAAAHRPGDARHLRPAGPPPRHAGDQAAARGPVLRLAAPEALRRARPPRQQPLARARGVPGDGAWPRCAARLAELGIEAEVTGRRQAPVEPLREDGRQGPRVRRHLRPRRGAGHRRLDEGLLRRARLHPRPLAAGGGAVQGLHRDAQVQPLPELAHDGHRARRQADRGADPHPRDAPAGRVGRRRPLGVQGRLAVGRHRLAQPDHRLAGRGQRPGPVHAEPEDRPRAGRGLRVHAQGPGRHAAGRLDDGRLRLRRAHRGRPRVHRRQGQRSAGGARPPAAQRRHVRDLHLQGRDGRAVAGLAAVRRLAAGPQQDPPVVQPRAAPRHDRGRARRAGRGAPPRGPAGAADVGVGAAARP